VICDWLVVTWACKAVTGALSAWTSCVTMLCQSKEPYVAPVIDETLTELVVDMVREGILQRDAIGTRAPGINQYL
jgi:hypothetical protein